ncbi:hypothetical protein K474DRAFT_1516977 [Panus rudis PR-1116 ss-1]|nr:hypothetical protein K474DRAFT_1516977 [Panus rudis PR-1116 ss-1]
MGLHIHLRVPHEGIIIRLCRRSILHRRSSKVERIVKERSGYFSAGCIDTRRGQLLRSDRAQRRLALRTSCRSRLSSTGGGGNGRWDRLQITIASIPTKLGPFSVVIRLRGSLLDGLSPNWFAFSTCSFIIESIGVISLGGGCICSGFFGSLVDARTLVVVCDHDRPSRARTNDPTIVVEHREVDMESNLLSMVAAIARDA